MSSERKFLALKLKLAWIVFFITLLIALPFRFYQLFFRMDQKNTFYTDGGLSSIIMFSLFAVSLVIVIIMFLGVKNAPNEYKPIKNILLALVCALTGVGIIFHSFWSLIHPQTYTEEFSISIIGSAASSGVLQTMQMVLSIFGILAGLIVLITAFNFFAGINIYRNFPVVALIPSLWGCVSLAVLFVTNTGVVNAAENANDMFTVIFTLLFLYIQSRIFAGVDVSKSAKMIYIVGYTGILFAVITSVPGILFYLNGMTTVGSFDFSFHILNLCLAVYMLVFLRVFSLSFTDKNNAAHLQDKQKNTVSNG